jgi:hypothetical protein
MIQDLKGQERRRGRFLLLRDNISIISEIEYYRRKRRERGGVTLSLLLLLLLSLSPACCYVFLTKDISGEVAGSIAQF